MLGPEGPEPPQGLAGLSWKILAEQILGFNAPALQMGWPMEETQKEADDIQEGWKWLEVCMVHVPGWKPYGLSLCSISRSRISLVWIFILQDIHSDALNTTIYNLKASSSDCWSKRWASIMRHHSDDWWLDGWNHPYQYCGLGKSWALQSWVGVKVGEGLQRWNNLKTINQRQVFKQSTCRISFLNLF
jgi:hypothetical protein